MSDSELTTLLIAVKDLPDGYFKEQLLKLAETPETKVYVVAKQGMIKDWAAYIGWPISLSSYGKSCDYSGWYAGYSSNEYGVVSNGDKVGEDFARQLFPMFKDYMYRR